MFGKTKAFEDNRFVCLKPILESGNLSDTKEGGWVMKEPFAVSTKQEFVTSKVILSDLSDKLFFLMVEVKG